MNIEKLKKALVGKTLSYYTLDDMMVDFGCLSNIYDSDLIEISMQTGSTYYWFNDGGYTLDNKIVVEFDVDEYDDLTIKNIYHERV